MLAAAGKAIEALEDTHRNAAIAPTVQIYAVALYLRTDPDAWLEFCHQPVWMTFRGKKPSPETQKEALRYAFRFAYGFDGTVATKRASKDAKMLQSAFSRGLTPEAAAKEITDAGGSEAYSRRQQKSRAIGEVNHTDVVIRLVAGKNLDRILSVAAGRGLKLEIEVEHREGRIVEAKARKVLRMKRKA